MSKFRDVFTSKHVILPVIHVKDESQTRRNVWIARKAGADGVFLINHVIANIHLLDLHRRIVQEHGDWWIGVNCLGLVAVDAFFQAGNVAGVWVDNAMIQEDQEEQPYAQAVMDAQERIGWTGLYFGGVAFKYQRSVEDLEKAAKIATGFMDVITTSGPGTGEAADPIKIQRLKSAAGNHPLAIASGITPDNVADYLAADCFMVATGISRGFDDLDPYLLRSLVQTVRSCEKLSLRRPNPDLVKTPKQ